MIKKLQKKFIFITAAALFVMILSVMAAVNGIFLYQTNKMLDSRLKQIMAEPPSLLRNLPLLSNIPLTLNQRA